MTAAYAQTQHWKHHYNVIQENFKIIGEKLETRNIRINDSLDKELTSKN